MDNFGPVVFAGGAAGLGIAKFVAQVTDGETTPLLVVAGVLASVVALLGWLVKSTQNAGVQRERAAREERKEDRESLIASFKEESSANREAWRESVRDLTSEIRSGSGCGYKPESRS